MKLLYVVGARPNFMKAAAVIAAADRWNRDTEASGQGGGQQNPHLEQVLVHTGQHYDEKMSKVFFDDLGLPRPDYDLGVGSGSHAEQTARVMLALEPIILEQAPDIVVTVGDINSTVAAALVAAKLGICLAHVEAGLRSYDRSMPEELNRLVTDQLSDLLFTISRDADSNLESEGIPRERIHFVGNTMIDSLQSHLSRALESPIVSDMHLTPGTYAVATLHRPSNVDEHTGLKLLVDTLVETSERLPVVFPVHARTRQRLAHFGLYERLDDGQRQKEGQHQGAAGVILCEPLGYLDFLSLMANARLVLTDSGGIQEETTVLGVPCLTLRPNTERPITITEGTNRLVDPRDTEAIMSAVDDALSSSQVGVEDSSVQGLTLDKGRRPELWDGKAGDRIVRVIMETLRQRGTASQLGP